MKKLLMILLFVIVGCEKAKKLELKTIEPVRIPVITMPEAAKVKGLKCQLVSTEDNRPIFLKTETLDDKLEVAIKDFTGPNSVSINAHINELLITTFLLSEDSSEPTQMVGTTPFVGTYKQDESLEGRIIAMNGKLILNKDLSGEILQSAVVLKPDNTLTNTEYENVAFLEDCQDFEAEGY